MSKAIGYVRVSSEEQVREGWSLDAQREKIELYSRLHNLELTEIISDEGISACNVKGRPGMSRLIEMTTANRSTSVQAIVTVKLDRLFRNAAEALKYAEAWRKRDIELHSIHEGVQSHGAAGKMFFNLLAVFAEFERDQCSERTRAGLAKRKSQGLKLGGEAPYGYQAGSSGLLVKNSDEQKVIRRVQKFREQNWTLQRITDELNRQGFSTRKGTPWQVVYIHNILKIIEKSDCDG